MFPKTLQIFNINSLQYRKKKLERNLENSIVAFKSIPCTDLSKTAKILNKLTGDDPLVHEFSVLKLQNTLKVRN